MPDGNLLTLMGLDVQLLTAGSCGGLVKAIFDRSNPVDVATTMVAGALTANYMAATVVQLAAAGTFGFKLAPSPPVAAFFLGLFSMLIVGYLAMKLRSKTTEEKKP